MFHDQKLTKVFLDSAWSLLIVIQYVITLDAK